MEFLLVVEAVVSNSRAVDLSLILAVLGLVLSKFIAKDWRIFILFVVITTCNMIIMIRFW